MDEILGLGEAVNQFYGSLVFLFCVGLGLLSCCRDTGWTPRERFLQHFTQTQKHDCEREPFSTVRVCFQLTIKVILNCSQFC